MRQPKGFRPFTENMGQTLLLPHTAWSFTLQPQRLHFQSLEGGVEEEITLHWPGGVRHLMAFQELDRGGITCFIDKRWRYRLLPHEGGMRLTLLRSPPEGISVGFSGKKQTLHRGEGVDIPWGKRIIDPQVKTMIHCGVHKALCWERLVRRNSLAEILPLWHHLGRGYPSLALSNLGNGELVEGLKAAIVERNRLKTEPLLLDLFAVAFSQGGAPTFHDPHQRGLTPPLTSPPSALPLLGSLSSLLLSLFLRMEGERLQLFPCLPPSLHCGNITGYSAWGGGLLIALRWVKRRPFQLTLSPARSGSIAIDLPKGLTSFRVRDGRGDSGHRYRGGDPLTLIAGKTYQIDRFI
ncbi:MAG: hypothetical protein VXZ72_01895 [Chlamydiota bacterium]|nr:hypothetical protein [Chlamydiota bacterium]